MPVAQTGLTVTSLPVGEKVSKLALLEKSPWDLKLTLVIDLTNVFGDTILKIQSLLFSKTDCV